MIRYRGIIFDKVDELLEYQVAIGELQPHIPPKAPAAVTAGAPIGRPGHGPIKRKPAMNTHPSYGGDVPLGMVPLSPEQAMAAIGIQTIDSGDTTTNSGAEVDGFSLDAPLPQD